MAAGRRGRRLVADINVVPYIDVMLVLLIIFMVTAPLLTQGVQVDLPEAAAKPLPDQDREPLVVSVDREGRFYVNVGQDEDRPVDETVLVQRVQTVLARDPQTPVLLKADEQVPYGRVVGAMTLLDGAGATRIGFLTEPPAPTVRAAGR
ncbi:MAG: protein TolR [Steroidobacteraceae bacterium]|jgi:biopolymer transport protein TolR|nr:protein TolR [Steroidobacteraceae bacterium]